MPCDRVTVIQVDLGNVNRERLYKVLADQGWSNIRLTEDLLTAYQGGMTLVVDAQGARLSGSSLSQKTADAMLAKLKRAYAAKTVQEASRKFGWRVASSQEKNDTIRMKLQR